MKILFTKIVTITLLLFAVHSSAFTQQWGNALALVPGNRVSFEASSSPNLVNNFSIGAWIYIDASCTNICPIVANKLAGNNNEGFAFYVNDWNTNNRRLVLESGVPGAYTSSSVIPNNVWTHVAVTVSSTNVPVMYVNGVSVALASSTVNIMGVSNKRMYIGCLTDPSYVNYSGKIDELSIWNKVLTPAEINSNVSTPLMGTESGLLAYYNFNEGDAGQPNPGITNLPDRKQNGTNNGTLIGFTLNGQTSNWVASDITTTCINPSNGGEITGSQNICYNTTPTAFTSTSLPTGHDGTLEYKWQSSTTDAFTGFSDIAASNATTYAAGTLTTTTWYKRIARVSCMSDWTGAAESNVLEVTVNPLPMPTIYASGSTTFCNGNSVALSAGGNALKFGSNSSVEIDDNAALRFTSAQSYTLAAWIYVPNNTSTWRGVITKSRDIILNGHYGIYIDAENKWVYGGELNIVGGAATPGWHHVAIVQQGNGNRELFVDGVSNVIGTAKNAAGTGKLRIGQSYNNFEKFDGGIVDECVLFNTNLSQATIQSWMNKSLTSSHPNYANLVGYWKLDEGIGALTTADVSGNGNTGTLVNSPVWVATTAPVNQYASYLWSPGGVTTPIYNVSTSGTYTVTVMDANGCSNTSAGTTITVRNQFTAGEISTTGETICYGGTPTEIGSSTAASGGDENITYQWQSSTDAEFTTPITINSNTATYDPPTGLLVTTWYRRQATDATCNTTFTSSMGVWKVEVEPVSLSGSLDKIPNVLAVCENTNVSAILTPGNGGNGIDELEFHTNDGTWSAWAAYTSGTEISTADLSGIEIRTRRTATTCSSSAYTTVGWTIEATPIAGLLTKTPDMLNVCENDNVSATLSSGNGGNGIDELEFRLNDGTWSAWAAYTSGAEISTADLSGVEIRTRRAASTCSSSAYTTISWNVEATPIAGLLVKTPNVMNVCENEVISALFTPGNGGNGMDELEFRTNDGIWSAWSAYTSGAEISTADLSGVEIRTRRAATTCSSSAYTTVNWSVEATPIAGLLTKTPDMLNVCENDIVSAILSSGNGGNGIDELEFRSNDGIWSAWTAYTSGAEISTADLSGVEIRTRRAASSCSSSDYTTVSWNVEATPIAGLISKTPDAMNVCENDIVSAILTSGNGGNGIDELEFRTNDGIWSAWAAYTSGAEISTVDLSGVEIRTCRAATTCSSSAYTTVGWSIEATPIAGSLTKTPDVINIGENDMVSAILTSGNGGNGIDELEFRTNDGNWSAWTAYTSGAQISTADLSGVEIHTRRTAAYCENSEYVTVGWTIEATPVAGVLTKSPDVINVCENDIVSAILTSGNGGNGIDELEVRTNDGAWSAWTSYTSGADISTADLSGVEIRTRRTAAYCENSEYVTIGWSIEATPIAGLLIKTPDIDDVCKGELVFATFIPGTGGNGTDELEYRIHDGSAWAEWNTYISGTSINTANLTSVEIRTWRTAAYCENSATNVVSWNTNTHTVAGFVSGPSGVCYGTNSTLLTASGYNGSIVMWQSSTDYWTTITNIQNTEPTLLIENLTVTTQFRTVTQSGSCDQLYSMAAEIGVDPLPAPFISGAASVCDLEEIYEYATQPDMVDYQWSVSSGQIISGHGSNFVTVQWSGSDNPSISVDYQTAFGCTMPEPFSFDVEILTPETPLISLNGFTLTSSASDGNQWYLNGIIIEGATSQIYEATENGDYTNIVSLNECASAESNTITILNVNTNPSLSFSMEVYPVPNNGLFTVKLLSPGSSNYTLNVYNALGSVVYSIESIVVNPGFSQMINLTNFPTGIYTVVMQNENQRFIRKIVITK